MIRLDRFLTGLLASQQDAEQRSVLRRYTIWHLVRRLRQRNNGSPLTPQGFMSARQRAHAAVAFLKGLRDHGLTLETCQQADLDQRLIGESTTYRQTAGHLIRWAHANKLTAVHVPAIRWNGPTELLRAGPRSGDARQAQRARPPGS